MTRLRVGSVYCVRAIPGRVQQSLDFASAMSFRRRPGRTVGKARIARNGAVLP